MYGIISKRDFSFLADNFGEPVFHIREISEFSNTLDEASRLKLDFLILEIGTYDSGLVYSLHKYRIQRPESRIIVIVPPDKKPGDELIARIVSLGIYDIFEGDELWAENLIAALKSPPSYGKAARWLSLEAETEKNKDNNQVKVREVLIPVPLGLTVVAVAGAGSGSGTSHLSLLFASHIAHKNKKVLLAEWPEGGGEKSQYSNLSGKFSWKGVDILEDARRMKSIENVFDFAHSYEYLILDLGSLRDSMEKKLGEMNRAALSVIVTHAAPFRWHEFFFLRNRINVTKYRIVLNLAGKKEAELFMERFGLNEVYLLPYVSYDEYHESIGEILKPVLPGGRKEKAVLKIFKR